MKIALLHPQCRIQGGAIKMALLAARSLQSQGHDVTLYTFDHSPECFAELQRGVNIVEWKGFTSSPFKGREKQSEQGDSQHQSRNPISPHEISSPLKGAQGVKITPKKTPGKLFSIISLAWHLRHVDIVVANNPPMQIVAALTKVFSWRTKTIWWHHHTPWYMKGERVTLRIKSLLERLCIVPFVDEMVATSHFVAGQIQQYCGREAQVIHPIVVPSTQYQVLSAEKKAENTITLFTHGRLEPGKGLDTIVNVWKRLQTEYLGKKDIRLIVAGSGSLADWLREQGAEVVPFDRVRTFESVKSGLTSVICVYASTIDAFGMAPLEAQMSGLPTVILDRGGARETILTDMSGNPVGHLVQSEEAIYASICHFIEHKLFPKPVSIVNFCYTIEHFTPSRLDRDLGFLMSKTKE